MSDENLDTTPDVEDAEAPDAAENSPQDVPDASAEPDAVDDTDEDTEDAQDEPQDEETETGRRPGVRQRLAEAEAERDQLRDTLDRQRLAVYEDALNRAGVTGVLMRAADRGLESLVGDDGVIWPADVTGAASQVAADAGIPRRPAPDPMVGRGGEPNVKPKVTFGTLLQAAAQGQ